MIHYNPYIKPAPVPPKNGVKKIILGILIFIFATLALLFFPFFILIRVSLYLNLQQDWNAWFALISGIIATVLVLMLYSAILFRKYAEHKNFWKWSAKILSLFVLSFSLYGLFYLSGVNAKNDEVKSVYRSLHPVLRVAVATTTLADGKLVITDISRNPEDYARMGLGLNQNSAHFKQSDGYVHAIDLRTQGRGVIRNFILKQSLNLLGFSTLRHTGTADHLHVSLPR